MRTAGVYYAKRAMKQPAGKQTPLDFAVIAAALLLAAAIWITAFFGSKSAERVKVVCGEKSYYYNIDSDLTMDFVSDDGLKVTVRAENGSVWIESSDCSDKICVKSGKITRAGEAVVCAPAKVAVMITSSGGGKGEDADAFAY